MTIISKVSLLKALHIKVATHHLLFINSRLPIMEGNVMDITSIHFTTTQKEHVLPLDELSTQP